MKKMLTLLLLSNIFALEIKPAYKTIWVYVDHFERLIQACNFGDIKLRCRGINKKDRLEHFIKNSEYINTCRLDSLPALHTAISSTHYIDEEGQKRREYIINAILSNPNVDVNLQDKDGDTPLIKAAQFNPLGDSHYRIIIELLRKGANVTIKNNTGISFLDCAARDPQLLRIYQAHQDVVNFRAEVLKSLIPEMPNELCKEISQYLDYAPDLPKQNKVDDEANN